MEMAYDDQQEKERDAQEGPHASADLLQLGRRMRRQGMADRSLQQQQQAQGQFDDYVKTVAAKSDPP